MITFEQFIDCIFQSFDASAIKDFRRFLQKNPGATKWIIAADYCLHDAQRPNNAYAFSILPYDAELDQLRDEIKLHLPRDLKKAKELSEEGQKFLKQDRRYHIGFVLKGNPWFFYSPDGTAPLELARRTIDAELESAKNMGRGDDLIRRLKKLKQESQANSFNHRLLADMYILIYLFTFVTVLLARERQIEGVGWFSDRDKMTEWSDGIVWHLATLALRGIAEKRNVPLPQSSPVIGVPDQAKQEGAMWFDELIRLPDYIAGILSAWDFEQNFLPPTRQEKNKYLQLAQDVIADSQNTAIINIRYDQVVSASQILTSRRPFESPQA